MRTLYFCPVSFFLFFLSFFLMTALCSRAGHYIFVLWFLLLSSLWPPYVIGQTIFISEREREANVNSLFAVARPSVCLSSVVCNVRAPYSGGPNFQQYFYGIEDIGHPLTSTEFHGDRPRGTPQPGELNTRGVAKYSDFGPIDGYTRVVPKVFGLTGKFWV